MKRERGGGKWGDRCQRMEGRVNTKDARERVCVFGEGVKACKRDYSCFSVFRWKMETGNEVELSHSSRSLSRFPSCR